MNNNYKLMCTDIANGVKSFSVVYYFETLEQAEKAKKAIENGGNKVKIKKV